MILGAGAQLITPAQRARVGAAPGQPTPVGSFNVTQLGDKADKIGKDDNFRGLTIYDNVLYYTKGSGGNGVNTVYFLDTTGKACPNGAGLPAAGRAAADLAAQLRPGDAADRRAAEQHVHPEGLQHHAGQDVDDLVPVRPVVRERRHPVRRRRGQRRQHLRAAALHRGGGADHGRAAEVGLRRERQWKLAYTLQAGLDLGQPYTVRGYPTGDNAATGLPWAPATDGLRNLTGQVNRNGTVTIWAITSTVSGSGDQGADPNKLVGSPTTAGAAARPRARASAPCGPPGSARCCGASRSLPARGGGSGWHDGRTWAHDSHDRQATRAERQDPYAVPLGWRLVLGELLTRCPPGRWRRRPTWRTGVGPRRRGSPADGYPRGPAVLSLTTPKTFVTTRVLDLARGFSRYRGSPSWDPPASPRDSGSRCSARDRHRRARHRRRSGRSGRPCLAMPTNPARTGRPTLWSTRRTGTRRVVPADGRTPPAAQPHPLRRDVPHDEARRRMDADRGRRAGLPTTARPRRSGSSPTPRATRPASAPGRAATPAAPANRRRTTWPRRGRRRYQYWCQLLQLPSALVWRSSPLLEIQVLPQVARSHRPVRLTMPL